MRTGDGCTAVVPGFRMSVTKRSIRVPYLARSAHFRDLGEANTSLLDAPGPSRSSQTARSAPRGTKVTPLAEADYNLKDFMNIGRRAAVIRRGLQQKPPSLGRENAPAATLTKSGQSDKIPALKSLLVRRTYGVCCDSVLRVLASYRY